MVHEGVESTILPRRDAFGASFAPGPLYSGWNVFGL
jgi:hypothetical protein